MHRGWARSKRHAWPRSWGVELPPAGGSVAAEVPGGVLYRAVAVSTLDLRRPEARQVLAGLLATAEMQRGVMGGPVA